MNAAPDQLRAYVERVERLEAEIKDLNRDKSELYAEAKGNGFDVPTIKKIVRIRKLDHAERQEQDALLDLYMSALGMLPADEPSRVHVHEGRSSHDLGGRPLSSHDGRPTSPAGAEGEANRQPILEHTTAPGEPASAGAAVDAIPSPRSLSQEAA